jgi:hypothetical protein
VILLVYICDLRMFLLCLLAVVAAISWLVPGWQDAAPDGCQILAGSRMHPTSRQVTIGVAYVSVTGVN